MTSSGLISQWNFNENKLDASGNGNEGIIIQIVISIITCGIAGIIPFIEGIIYLTKSSGARLHRVPT